jgi:thioesterase domain-containing protein/acyl carrier protein
VAYAACPDAGADASLGATLRARLVESLPAFLVPAAVVVLPALPRTPNGKVDRDALPEAELAAREIVPPRGEIEEQLAALWRELLGLDEVSVNESFFDLGGHSLLAVRLFALLDKRHGHRLPLAAIVSTPTIAGLAAVLRGDVASTDESYISLVPLQPRGERPPIYVVHEVTGEVIGYRSLIRHLGADQPVYGFRSVGVDGNRPVLHRIEDMAATYVAELRRFQPTGPYLLLGSCFGGVVAYEMARQLKASGEVVDATIIINATPYGYAGADEGEDAKPLGSLLRVRTPTELRRHIVKRETAFRRRLHRTLWWRQARQYVESGRLLPARLHEMITLHHVSASLYRARPYDGLVVNIIADDSPAAVDHDRRLLWHELVKQHVPVKVREPGVQRADFLVSPHIEHAAQMLRECLDTVAAK